MSGIKPEQFDYHAAVQKMDESGFDWESLVDATKDPGFGSLDAAQQKHVIDLLTVKSMSQETTDHPAMNVDPYARSGTQGALRQFGQLAKAMGYAAMGNVGGVATSLMADKSLEQTAIQDIASDTVSKQQATVIEHQQVLDAGKDIAQTFTHYLTGGIVAAPKESKDPYVREAMGPFRVAAQVGSGLAQFAIGSYALSWVSKVPMISSASMNLSATVRGLVKGAILDFGIMAAQPEGIPKENVPVSISDNIARFIAPDAVLKDPSSLAGRMIYGLSGAVEGGLLGSLLFGISSGVKLADAKYAFTLSKEQVEGMRKSLASVGVDAAEMSKRDVWTTYRTNMTKHVQDISQATFNGKRMSAESWIAQAFLADPNVAELTPHEGRLLWGVFSNNKGGISLLKGISDPEQALSKLKKVGINVEATVLPRRVVPSGGTVPGPGPNTTHTVEPIVPTVSELEIEGGEPLGNSAKSAPSAGVREQPTVQPEGTGTAKQVDSRRKSKKSKKASSNGQAQAASPEITGTIPTTNPARPFDPTTVKNPVDEAISQNVGSTVDDIIDRPVAEADKPRTGQAPPVEAQQDLSSYTVDPATLQEQARQQVISQESDHDLAGYLVNDLVWGGNRDSEVGRAAMEFNSTRYNELRQRGFSDEDVIRLYTGFAQNNKFSDRHIAKTLDRLHEFLKGQARPRLSTADVPVVGVLGKDMNPELTKLQEQLRTVTTKLDEQTQLKATGKHNPQYMGRLRKKAIDLLAKAEKLKGQQ